MTTPSLALSYAEVPFVFRKGSPLQMKRGYRAELRPGVLTQNRSYAGDDGSLMTIDRPEETFLDLDEPSGRDDALAWLLTKKFVDLRWATAWPTFLAYSVLSVARGGPPIQEALGPWTTHDPEGEGAGRCWARRPIRCPTGSGVWVRERLLGSCGWQCAFVRDPKTGLWRQGLEVGDDAKRLVEGLALDRHYGLIDDDGSVRVPPLPPVAEPSA